MLHVTMRIATLLWFVFFLFTCSAGSKDLPPAVGCETPRIFYVVSHGWHTGVVVKRRNLIAAAPSLARDFVDGQYLEIGWGDARFYQARTVTPDLVLRAALWPTEAVIHVAEVPTNPRSYFSLSEVLEVSVPEAGYERLLRFIAGSLTRTADNEVIKVGPGLYGNSWFYRAEGFFHTFNTCNTWVAEAIESSGFPLINPAPITVNGVLSQLRRGTYEDSCYGVR